MSEPTDLRHVASENDSQSATQLGLLLDVATLRVEEQFKIGDRLDAKSRNQVTVAATFFAGVQAGVISLVNGILGPSESTPSLVNGILVPGRSVPASPYVPYLAAAAGVAVLALLLAVVMSFRAWRLRPELSIDVETIRKYIPFARDDEPGFGANLVWAHTKLVEARQEQNTDRADALRRAGWACLATLVVAGIELMLAFVAIIHP